MDLLQYKIARVLIEELGEAINVWMPEEKQDLSIQVIVTGIFDCEGLPASEEASKTRVNDTYPGLTLITETIFDINRDVDLIHLSVGFYQDTERQYFCRLGITDGLHYVIFREQETKHESWKIAIATMAQVVMDHFVKDLGLSDDHNTDQGFPDLRHYLQKVN